ncbi:MAG: hypothetical protein JW776_00895 [Candidatus Lokiarchaeota archaeon]|nr:hypothetical protein [Candidatus Lokiarchaeota archaeon]
MKLWKSLVVGLVSYVLLTFLANIVFIALTGTPSFSLYFSDIWGVIVSAFTGLDGLQPVSVEIFNTIAVAVGSYPFTTGIIGWLTAGASILVPIVPGLVAAILAGKVGKRTINGFFGMFLTGIICSVVPIIIYFISPVSVAPYLSFILSEFSGTAIILTMTGVIGIFIGTFWAAIGAFFGKMD